MNWEFFPVLQRSEIAHGFTQRSFQPLSELESEFFDSCQLHDIHPSSIIQAEQVHGREVGVVFHPSSARIPAVDALITNVPRIALAIRVADCGPIFFFDPKQKAIGLAHSGKKGTALNIAVSTIQAMNRYYGSQPEDLIAQLGPCIRPPHYEIDFAAEIGHQIRSAGVKQYFDCQTCTACHLETYYSYRAEKGNTGRMWAVLMLRS